MTGGSEQIHNPHHKMKEPSNETHHMVTGAKEHIHNHHDMVARGSEEFRNGHHNSPAHKQYSAQLTQ